MQNMQWLVKRVSSSFSKDLSHEAKAKFKDSTRKANDSTLKTKTKDFKIVLKDPRWWRLVLEDSNTDFGTAKFYDFSKVVLCVCICL